MYKEYFGFKELPFSIAPDPRFLFMSEQHREAMAHLVYGLKTEGGFVLLTGDVGTGKTTVCRCLLDVIREDTNIAFILNPRVTAAELLATVCDELGIFYHQGNTSIKVFVDSINKYLLDSHAAGRKTVLIIEEAQNLLPDVLEQIRLMTNLETNERKLLQIVMIGQPELREMLSRPDMEQLSQRITARCHLGPLSRDEIDGYISHRISVAGGKGRIFPRSVLGRLHRLSRGIPRLINVICDRSLLGAYVQGDEKVNRKTLNRAAKEVFGKHGRDVKRMRLKLKWMSPIVALIFLVSAAIYYYINEMRPDTKSVRIPNVQESEAKADIKREEPLRWPAGRDMAGSKGDAYKALFAEWNLSYEASEGDVCGFAATKDLRCLEGSGSFPELIGLNRPAVVRLFGDGGEEIYGMLERIEGNYATVLIGGETRTVGLSDIENRWAGDYLLFWKAPKDYRDPIYRGNGKITSRWLEERLSSLTGEIGGKSGTQGDDDLGVRIRKFQVSNGLEPDGIPGPKTVIHLINKKGSDEPLLSIKGRGGK